MVKRIYNLLLKAYGLQGWWPLRSCPGDGYHPGDYAAVKKFSDGFEIMLGAILTQNTAWSNVRRALGQLYSSRRVTPRGLLTLPEQELAELIKPSGYYNQKAKKIRVLCDFLLKEKLTAGNRIPSREQLLGLWGIGPETADSILLYAFQMPLFVIDAYTRRIFSRLGLVDAGIDYIGLQNFFQKDLEPEPALYNEYHALLVRHAREVCRVTPLCQACPLQVICSNSRGD